GARGWVGAERVEQGGPRHLVVVVLDVDAEGSGDAEVADFVGGSHRDAGPPFADVVGERIELVALAAGLGDGLDRPDRGLAERVADRDRRLEERTERGGGTAIRAPGAIGQ